MAYLKCFWVILGQEISSVLLIFHNYTLFTMLHLEMSSGRQYVTVSLRMILLKIIQYLDSVYVCTTKTRVVRRSSFIQVICLSSVFCVLQNIVKFEDATGIVFNHVRLLARAFTMRNIGFNNLTL